MECNNCNGFGWYAGHDHPHTHDPKTGECLSCPVQIQCEECRGSGKLEEEEEEEV